MVSADREALQPCFTVKNFQGRHGSHRCAIGVSNDSLLGFTNGIRIDLADNQGNVRIHSEG